RKLAMARSSYPSRLKSAPIRWRGRSIGPGSTARMAAAGPGEGRRVAIPAYREGRARAQRTPRIKRLITLRRLPSFSSSRKLQVPDGVARDRTGEIGGSQEKGCVSARCIIHALPVRPTGRGRRNASLFLTSPDLTGTKRD